MLTTNIDTTDGLTNGTFGQVVGFEKNDKRISGILIEFLNERSGRELRKRRPDLTKKYPGQNVTIIRKFEQEYSLTGKSKGSATATAIQFPVKLVFAATAHKVQGMTVKKPKSLVIDLRGRIQPAMAYIMLSRVQALDQLFILGSLPENKIMASSEALEELERMEKVALNSQWRDRNPKISSVNISRLKKHFKDMKSSPTIQKSDVICIQETWIDPHHDETKNLNLDNYSSQFSSIGGGKGITTYYRESFQFKEEIIKPMYQFCKVSSEEKDVINVYRSSNAPPSFLDDLKAMIDEEKRTDIVGDFNVCYKSERQNVIIKYLEERGFRYDINKV